MPDYGGINDGQCEFSFFTRCLEPAVEKVTYGQQRAWTYRYCLGHAALVKTRKAETDTDQETDDAR